MAGTWSIALFI